MKECGLATVHHREVAGRGVVHGGGLETVQPTDSPGSGQPGEHLASGGPAPVRRLRVERPGEGTVQLDQFPRLSGVSVGGRGEEDGCDGWGEGFTQPGPPGGIPGRRVAGGSGREGQRGGQNVRGVARAQSMGELRVQPGPGLQEQCAETVLDIALARNHRPAV